MSGLAGPQSADLARLASRGPRYTSYPPAPHFQPGFAEAEATLKDRSELARQRGVSLYLHVPFCSSLCWYCGCNVKITRDRERGSRYVDTLIKEVKLYGELLPDSFLAELSLGGGSPNFLAAPDLARLVTAVEEVFARRPESVLGIELDPRDTTEEQVAMLAEHGFSRLSVGVQDFDEKVQKTIHRQQSALATSELIVRARQSGFTSVGVDLIYGLPGQTPQTMRRTLESVVEIRPDRLALFGYAHLPLLRKHQKLVERAPIPDLQQRADLLLAAIEVLCEAGYQRVGFDHFALPEDPLAIAARTGVLHRNFQGFTIERGGPLIACGVTGISDVGTAYWQNVADLEEWKSAVDAGRLPIARGLTLSRDDTIRRHVIFRLMCDGVIEMTPLSTDLEIDFRDYFASELEQLRAKEYSELVRVDDDRVEPTPIGFELIRNIGMVFDRYLPEKPAGSTTI
jgi:oxygen-independent coproporphyrinogen-3 oxidase